LPAVAPRRSDAQRNRERILEVALAGIRQLDPDGPWESRAGRLFDLVMDGLRAGAPGGR